MFGFFLVSCVLASAQGLFLPQAAFVFASLFPTIIYISFLKVHF